VGVHSHRLRKTGPEIALVVAVCHAHGHHFTVYPPGHVPYGRAAVAPVDLAGRPVGAAQGDGGHGLSGTAFEPVRSAAQGERYGESGDARGSRRTQGRRLCWAALLLGLSAPVRLRERLSSVLGVPALSLHEAAATYGADRSWRARARTLMRVVSQVLAAGRPFLLLHAGQVAGLWGRPSRWDPGG